MGLVRYARKCMGMDLVFLSALPVQRNDGRNELSSENGKRVVRGGSWYDRPYRSTSSFRLPYREYQKVYNVGFRVVMTEE